MRRKNSHRIVMTLCLLTGPPAAIASEGSRGIVTRGAKSLNKTEASSLWPAKQASDAAPLRSVRQDQRETPNTGDMKQACRSDAKCKKDARCDVECDDCEVIPACDYFVVLPSPSTSPGPVSQAPALRSRTTLVTFLLGRFRAIFYR